MKLKATGIIVEYNPLHNGHVYHAEQAKITTEADLVIAVMSGNFLQRGEPAFVDKWARAQMALSSNVDIVFELPYRFATAHAPLFAKGAVQLLQAAGCDAFCFGSEEGSIDAFTNSLTLLSETEEQYEAAVKQAVAAGISYPKALNEAYAAVSNDTKANVKLADLSKPNNILGFHYMKAAEDIRSNMKAVTIKRMGANYHDDAEEGKRIASATGIRKSFFETAALSKVTGFIPPITNNLLERWQTTGKSFGSWQTFYPQLRFIILRDGPERLRSIADVTEGIENLFFKAAQKSDTFEDFMSTVKSKRYTWTRIQRMLVHILNGFTYEMREQMEMPSYLRLLGMSQKGRSYLHEQKKNFSLPVVSKVAAIKDPSLQMDCTASDIYAIGTANNKGHIEIGKDYSSPPIIAK
ncbi:nucleotidyltransferase [Sporosarcina sp. USHLN248]|uniref:nucleotidyltransferase n=1 Tax=Sporosarcina sp. USHLN248 TaxID=3081300 RepID=UPI003015AC9A